MTNFRTFAQKLCRGQFPAVELCNNSRVTFSFVREQGFRHFRNEGVRITLKIQWLVQLYQFFLGIGWIFKIFVAVLCKIFENKNMRQDSLISSWQFRQHDFCRQKFLRSPTSNNYIKCYLDIVKANIFPFLFNRSRILHPL